MRQAGRYLPEYRKLRAGAGSFLDLCYTPELAADATLQPLRRFALDAAIVFSDILVVPDALGQRVAFEEGRGPVLEPLEPGKGLNGLDTGGLVERLAPVYRAIALVRESLPQRAALIGFAGAPWTLASYMVEGGTSRDHARVKGWALRAPDSFAALIDLLVDATAQHLIAQAEAGAEVLQIFDSWAGILPAGLFASASLEPITRIAARVKAAHPAVPVIVFPRGAGLNYERFARIAEIDALSVDPTVPLSWVRSRLQASVAVQGNLDPVALLEGGAAMVNGAKAILDDLAAGPFVFNLGHGVLPSTPPEHVAKLVDFVHGYAAAGPAS